jgi:hypothetical protein
MEREKSMGENTVELVLGSFIFIRSTQNINLVEQRLDKPVGK